MENVDFSTLAPRDVLLEDAVPEYERTIGFFYLDQLVPLNASIYVLEEVFQFPFDVLVGPQGSVFFAMVVRNFFQAGVLTVTRLATDADANFNTLLQFKNWVSAHARSEYRHSLAHTLKQRGFDTRTRQLLERARRLRDGQVAHIKRGFTLSEQDRIDLDELKALRDRLNDLLAALSFNVGRMMLPVQYASEVIHPADMDARTDIQRLLDSIARDSDLLNQPERDPGNWPFYRGLRSEQELAIVNEYRVKFGLPEA